MITDTSVTIEQTEACRVRDLSVVARDRYGVKNLIVDNINFKIESGQVLALIGESGSGFRRGQSGWRRRTVSVSDRSTSPSRPKNFLCRPERRGLVQCGAKNKSAGHRDTTH